MATSNGTTVATGTTIEQLMLQLEAAKAENAALEVSLARAAALAGKRGPKVSSIKVSEKHGMSLHGLQRFPVTLYIEQWEAIIEAMPEIKAFMQAHATEFTRNPAK